jgi:hypothetical protein
VDPSDPLFEACRVLTRDELSDFFSAHFKALPRSQLGAGDEASRRSFFQEMQALDALTHPNIVQFYGSCGHGDGRVSFVMELVSGGTLSARCVSGPLPLREERPGVGVGASGGSSSGIDFGMSFRVPLSQDRRPRLIRSTALIDVPENYRRGSGTATGGFFDHAFDDIAGLFRMFGLIDMLGHEADDEDKERH